MNKNVKGSKFPKVIIYITSLSQCLYTVYIQLFKTIYFVYLVLVDFISYYHPTVKEYHLDGLYQSSLHVILSILIIESEQSFLGCQSLLEIC